MPFESVSFKKNAKRNETDCISIKMALVVSRIFGFIFPVYRIMSLAHPIQSYWNATSRASSFLENTGKQEKEMSNFKMKRIYTF